MSFSFIKGYLTLGDSGNVSHLAPGGDVTASAESLKAGWGSTWNVRGSQFTNTNCICCGQKEQHRKELRRAHPLLLLTRKNSLSSGTAFPSGIVVRVSLSLGILEIMRPRPHEVT